jgi:hypothetical protein
MASLDRALLAGLLLGIGACHPTSAATFSYRGTFAHDDDVQAISFSLSSVSEVTIRTYSYGGGLQADGTSIGHGGFDPILDLFNGTDNFIIEADDETAPGTANVDPDTHEAFDAVLGMTLGAGSYTVALVQYDNSAKGNTLAAGFLRSGNPTFTSTYGCSNGSFCDLGHHNRTGAWALDIFVSEVPEPSLYALLLIGLGALFAAPRLNHAH